MIRSSAFSLFSLLLTLTVRAEVVDIDNAELARLTAAGVPVIDIRTAGEWQQGGVVEGSRLITYVDERGHVDAPAWLAKVQAVAKPDQPVIIICRSGNRTRAAGQFLSGQAGYEKVYNVKDGMRAWVQEGRPVTAVASAVAQCPSGARC